MNRDEKAAAIAQIAGQIDQSEAIFAVDYRGISVAQVAELRAKLREADATFKVVKNSLTERAADEAGAVPIKDFLSGPTALTFVRGDVAVAAKAIADYARTTQLLPFKGGLMGGEPLDVDQMRSLSRLPSREVLYGQLVGVVASPVSGLVRRLGALVSGLAVALGQVREKKESGEIPAGAAPEPAAEEPAADTPAPEEAQEASEPKADEPKADEPAAEEPAAEEPAADEPAEEPKADEPAADEPAEEPKADEPAAEELAEEPKAEEPAAEAAPEDAPAEPSAEEKVEPEQQEPAQDDDKEADVSAEAQSEDAETNPTKED